MNPTPPGYPDPSASGPPRGVPQGGYPQGGAPQGGYPQGGAQQGGYPQGGAQQGGYQPSSAPQGGPQQGGYQQGGYPQGGYAPGGFPPGGQGPGGPRPQGSSPVGAARSRPRPAIPPLPDLAVIVVGALAVLNAVAGFLRSSQLIRSGGSAVPMGSVYAVAGWIPALLVVSGLLAVATRLKGVSIPTLWAASAATAVMGGAGALFYVVAREGSDAGVGFLLAAGGNGAVGSRASVGLILIVLFGLLQLAAAVSGLLLTQSPKLAERASRVPAGGPDVAHRYGPGAAGPGAAGPNQPPAQGFPGYGGQQAAAAPPAWGPAGAPSTYGPTQPSSGWTSYGAGSPGGGFAPNGPAEGGQGFVPAYPADGGIAPYGSYSQTEQFGASDDSRYAPPGWSPSGVTMDDPQSGLRVPTGLAETVPTAATPPPPPIPEPAPAGPGEAERALGSDPVTPVEYQRTEYGSSDFEWEPTYSEAPTYEARASEEEADESPREDVVRYEDPGHRPAFAPPKLDSARHEGWDAGFAEDTLTGNGQPVAEQDRYRSIPRAE